MTSSDDREILSLLPHYWSGAASSAERRRIEQWLARSSENAGRAQALREIWNERSAKYQNDPARVMARILATIAPQIPQASTTSASMSAADRGAVRVMSARGRSSRYPLLTVLAGGGLIAAATAALLVVRARSGWAPSSQATYVAPSGQRSTVTLADGSHVILAPNSRLVVGDRFGKGTRTVVLQGEAYFSVAPAVDAPFLVRTDAITTRVLGTAFNVRHYPADRAVVVAVESGKVSVRGRGNPVALTAGSVARVTDSTTTVQQSADVDAYVSWTSGRLVFDNTPVPIMLEAVGRWYGYEFRLTDSVLSTRHVTTVLTMDNPEKTMRMLQALLDVRMTWHDSVITLHRYSDTSSANGTTRLRRSRFPDSFPLQVGK